MFSQSTSSNSDRRCAPRVGITLPVKVQFENQVFSGKLIDLSPCGCALIGSQNLPLGSQPQLHLSLPSEEGRVQLALETETVRCSKIGEMYLTGLNFADQRPWQNYQLMAFFHYHQRFTV
ncbi:MAG: PilZ domain-containing protein [Thiotrichales bacterium]|nr:PilZ domain-containing protein [Thiotrichales bacterium]